MKRVLMMLVAVALLVSFTAPAADAAQFGQKGHNKTKISHQVKFKDVKGHWAENVLLQMTAKGYLN